LEFIKQRLFSVSRESEQEQTGHRPVSQIAAKTHHQSSSRPCRHPTCPLRLNKESSMSAVKSVHSPLTGSARIRELTSEASVDALNTLLDNYNIEPERVVAVHLVAGAGFASSPARYRVLYRAR
jgi:hypothetical protein